MILLEEVYKHLQKIKNKESSFQNLMNKGLKDYSENDAYSIKNSLKSIVNRYYYLSWELDKIFTYKEEDKDYFICALGQYQYVKHLTLEQIINELNMLIEDQTLVNKFKEVLNDLKPLEIDEKDNKIIHRKLAIQYSYPEWVCKMMCKHFGVKKTYRAIASSRKSVDISLNCNRFLTSSEKLVEEYPNYFQKSKTPNGLKYISKEKLIDIKPFKENKVYVEDESLQLLVSEMELNINDKVLLILDDKGTVSLDVANTIKDIGTVCVAAPHIIDYNSIKKLAYKFKIHSFDLFQTNVNELITHVEPKTCDKVLFVASSSNLGLIRRKPDILLSLKKEELDQIIATQKEQLQEVSTFVNSEGTLIYAVQTYNKKESTYVIEEFLKNNQDFTLIKEVQLFCNEIPSDGIYYAILKKKKYEELI